MFGNAQLSSWSAATRQAGITMGRHPLVWWIGARLVATREEACDEHVVAETAEPLAYAEGIVTVCRRYVEAPLMSVAGVGGADVKARIDAILSNRIGLRVTLPKRLVLATAAVVTFVVPLAAGAINRATLTAEQAQGATPGSSTGSKSQRPTKDWVRVAVHA